MSNLETIKHLITLGERASHYQMVIEVDGFAHWWVPMCGTTPIEFTPAARDTRDSNPYRPYTFDGKQSLFFAAAANARPALAGLVEEFRGLLEAAHYALQYIEVDEFKHGRKFGAGNTLREAIAGKVISEIPRLQKALNEAWLDFQSIDNCIRAKDPKVANLAKESAARVKEAWK